MKHFLQKTQLRALMLVALVLCGLGTTWGEDVTYTLTISASDFNTTSYAANNNEKTSNAVCTTDNTKTYEVKWTSYQVMKSSSNMQWQKSKGYIYNSTDLGTINSVTVNSSAGSFITYYGTSAQPSSGTTVGNGYFKTSVGSATGTTSSIVITFTISGSSLTPAGLSFGETTSYTVNLGENFTVPTLINPNSLTVAYSSSNTGVATVDATSGAVTLIGAGTTTITASSEETSTYAAGSTYYTLKVVDPNAPGTGNNPYTVAQAIENTPASGNSEDVYVKGVVSGFYKNDIISDGEYFRYYISDENVNNQLLVFKGKGLNNVAFSNADDLQIGDVVVVKGQLSTYNNTKEINSDNYIVSLKRKTTPTLSFGENAYSVVKNGTLTISATSNSTGDITYESSNTDVAEIDATSGVVTAKAAGTCTITATIAATDDYKSITATVELTVTAPKHKVTFYQNGEILSEVEVSEDTAIEFPVNLTDIEGKTFVGWIASTITGETNDAPTFITTATMGTSDVNYYAVFAIKTEGENTTTTDVLTANLIDAGSSYSNWNGKTVSSNAVYAGNSMTGQGVSIQLRSSNNSGVISTTSGGNLSKISVVWNNTTSDDRKLDIYGSNTAYSAASDLYNSSKQGTKLGSITYGTSTELAIDDDYNYIGIRSNSGALYLDKISITWEYTPVSYSAYCTTVLPPIELAAPIIFHDGGTYEQALKVAMAGQGTIKYKLNGGAEQTYSTPIDVNETTTITAWVEQDGSKSKEISKTFTIETKEAGPSIEDGYYTIKNNGNGMYVNVAGRRTVTFVKEADTAAAPGTVIKVKATDGQLEVLRSQGVDIPGYAQRAMNYVPALVKAIVERLGENNFIGEPGLNNVANEFTDKFDYHLYLEKLGNEGNNYRIYGKTPSMTPVVDFYAKNKEVIDGRLPYLEGFVKDIFTRIADKLGRGQGWVDSFKIHDLWVKMGGTELGLTEPVDEDAAAISQFYTQILSSEKNVWNFAHETMMIYWSRVKEYINDNEEISGLIGDYAKYIDKVEYIQPNFKYYIVQQNGQMDFISEGNTAITTSDVAAETDFTAWKLEKRSDFNVTFNAENTLNGDKELYTTLYTDFAYTLPDDVKAYAVTSINKKTGVAVKKEITGVIPAQTPVLLKLAVDEKVTENQTQTLTLSTEAGTAPETNLLVGPDYLINEYKINAPQVESMLSVLSMLSQSLADQYEYLKRKNAGTVNNKYFFGLTEDDLLLCTFKNEDDEEDCVVRNLSTGDKKLGFYNNWEVNANKAFLVSEEFDPIKLTLLGDVNRDGDVNVTDVSATVDISLGKATPETHSDVYDFDAADADESGSVDVTDAVIIVNISLGK